MKKYIKYSSVLFLFSILLFTMYACNVKSTEPDGTYVGYDYYPLKTGSYIIYDVYDTLYTGILRKDSLYQLKELIYTSYQEGDEVKYTLYQYFKSTTDTEWPIQPDSVWTLVNTSNQLIRTENNIPYIKLIFPVKEDAKWNGNAKNIYDEQSYTMKNLDQVYDVLGLSYSQTLMVEINKSQSIVDKDHRYEIYARGIGPIKKEYTVYAYDQNFLGQDIIDYGYHKVYFMTEHGKD